RLAQALRNLAGNAVAHTSEHDGIVRLEVTRLASERIRFSVLDDGPGIPDAERERVFLRFHRTDPARASRDGGAGLGLAIDRVVGVGGCWAQSVKEEIFARFPFVDVAFGPGQVHKLAEFLTSDSLTAQGYFEFEGFTGDLPAKRTREFQAWVQISVGCNCQC